MSVFVLIGFRIFLFIQETKEIWWVKCRFQETGLAFEGEIEEEEGMKRGILGVMSLSISNEWIGLTILWKCAVCNSNSNSNQKPERKWFLSTFCSTKMKEERKRGKKPFHLPLTSDGEKNITRKWFQRLLRQTPFYDWIALPQ